MKKLTSGITLVEILATIAVLSLLIIVVLTMVDPPSQEKRRRDVKRFSDLSVIFNAVEHYKVDYDELPGNLNIIYTSKDFNTTFWLEIQPYLRVFLADPVNNGEFTYRYKQDGSSYELDVMVESKEGLIEAEKDGGNDNLRFEVGTDLNIL